MSSGQEWANEQLAGNTPEGQAILILSKRVEELRDALADQKREHGKAVAQIAALLSETRGLEDRLHAAQNALAASGGEWVLRLVAWSSLDDSRRSVVRAALVWRWRGKLTRRSRRETVNEDRVMAGPADWVLGRMLRYGDERRALALEAGAAA